MLFNFIHFLIVYLFEKMIKRKGDWLYIIWDYRLYVVIDNYIHTAVREGGGVDLVLLNSPRPLIWAGSKLSSYEIRTAPEIIKCYMSDYLNTASHPKEDFQVYFTWKML